jgi:hypothetical protein
MAIDQRVGVAQAERHSTTCSNSVMTSATAGLSGLRAPFPGPLHVGDAGHWKAALQAEGSTICGRMSPLIACRTRQPSSLWPCSSASAESSTKTRRDLLRSSLPRHLYRLRAFRLYEIFGKPARLRSGLEGAGKIRRRSPRGRRAGLLHGSYSWWCDRLYLVAAAVGPYLTPSIGDRSDVDHPSLNSGLGIYT